MFRKNEEHQRQSSYEAFFQLFQEISVNKVLKILLRVENQENAIYIFLVYNHHRSKIWLRIQVNVKRNDLTSKIQVQLQFNYIFPFYLEGVSLFSQVGELYFKFSTKKITTLKNSRNSYNQNCSNTSAAFREILQALISCSSVLNTFGKVPEQQK